MGRVEGVYVALMCCVLVVADSWNQVLEAEWRQWKGQHRKGYWSGREERERRSVWLANREFVNNHNVNWQQEHGYSLSLNQFADLVSIETVS